MEFTIVLLCVVIVALLAVFFYYCPFFLWISAQVSGVHISLLQLVLMRIRKVPATVIVRALIEAHKAGLSGVTRDDLEAHYLAGGHVERVVHALVSANKANIDLEFKMATAIDLAGRDVFQAVQMSVNPKVIDTPPARHSMTYAGAACSLWWSAAPVYMWNRCSKAPSWPKYPRILLYALLWPGKVSGNSPIRWPR